MTKCRDVLDSALIGNYMKLMEDLRSLRTRGSCSEAEVFLGALGQYNRFFHEESLSRLDRNAKEILNGDLHSACWEVEELRRWNLLWSHLKFQSPRRQLKKRRKIVVQSVQICIDVSKLPGISHSRRRNGHHSCQKLELSSKDDVQTYATCEQVTNRSSCFGTAVNV
ncbi:hypothetical protein MPTK1_8g05390 [Marchantia polymorpha subsp. ruderalis]|uniref:Uncharacterized protein n=1 Tax=Marchantia polymorpha TaxID=3197 RepID=A0A2R6WKG4_MARPO|nr:hypothetical protein MARPO_0081s0040 [Marchantia polymorpha]BBN18774.1 hypothetical protein Mp_8g05390 [Marchantia polymorpha subsp. ruderalis]|eukprot:PTQ34313.1 hypothetical protein MARPO_0081s0040 [Marchantia polymorpha]